jgi:hypothetical protein
VKGSESGTKKTFGSGFVSWKTERLKNRSPAARQGKPIWAGMTVECKCVAVDGTDNANTSGELAGNSVQTIMTAN